MLLTLELALAGLILVVLGVGLLAGPDRERKVGVVAAAGLLGLVVLSLVFDGRGVLFDGTFVVDGLAMLFKRLFLGATLLGVVGGLALPGPAVRRRALEYHFLVLVSLLGMLVLASARELVLLFVAFELMSIPLYVLAGFAKSDARAVEAALKFFLVGSLSTAIFAYGLSFVYGAGASGGGAAWVTLAAFLGGVTVVAGNLLALPQTDAKRLLAYSGVAHIGYMLVGVAAMTPFGVGMVLFYLVGYVFSNIGAFMVVEVVGRAEGTTAIRGFRGLAQRSPVLALAMLLFLLSLGGIPFMVGFWAKLYVFWAAAQAGLYGLVLLGAVLTVVALFYYLVVAKAMYIEAPRSTTPIPVPPALALVILVSVAAVVLLGLYPRPLVDAALRAAAPL